MELAHGREHEAHGGARCLTTERLPHLAQGARRLRWFDYSSTGATWFNSMNARVVNGEPVELNVPSSGIAFKAKGGVIAKDLVS